MDRRMFSVNVIMIAYIHMILYLLLLLDLQFRAPVARYWYHSSMRNAD